MTGWALPEGTRCPYNEVRAAEEQWVDMSIFTRRRRRAATSPETAGVRSEDFDQLATAIAQSQARLLLIADRVASGKALPGDEGRLRLQREISTSYRSRLEKMALPTGIGDDAEAWLRSISTSA